MKTNKIKLFAIIFFASPLLLLAIFKTTPAKVAAVVTDDPAATYKAKCAMCHTPTASKFFDPARTDEEHVQSILKGKKGEKPPYMPAWETKGITEDDAKALAAYMRQLKVPGKANTNTSVNANTNTNANVIVNANTKGNVNGCTNTNVNDKVNASTSSKCN